MKIHTPFYLYHPHVIFYFFNTCSLQNIIIIVPQTCTLLNLFICFVTAVKSYHEPSNSEKKNMKYFKYVYGFKGHHLKMRDIFMDLSHVPGTIALSLFISKSSNLDKINDASDPNLSCGNQIIDCSQFQTRPCPLRNFRVTKSNRYPHAVLDCLFLIGWQTKN